MSNAQSLAGKWTYRSFYNDPMQVLDSPDEDTAAKKLLALMFAEAVFTFQIPDDTTLTGAIDWGTGGLDLKGKISNQGDALTVHTKIEEEIFYPAFLAATKDKDMHHEAEIEHDGAKNLIAQIEASDPSDDYFDSKVHVLSEMIKHHVKEEEQSDGMFAEARAARKMDLQALGQTMFDRKQELMQELAEA